MAASNALNSLLDRIMGVLSGDGCAELRGNLRLRGYTIVGSTPLIGTDANAAEGDTDLDVVLLSDRPCGSHESGPSLMQVWLALRNNPEVKSLDVQYVNANVPLVKVTSRNPPSSLDLLWLSGVSLPDESCNDVVPVAIGILPTPPPLIHRVSPEPDANDAHIQMVIEPGGVCDEGRKEGYHQKGLQCEVYVPDPTLAEAAGDDIMVAAEQEDGKEGFCVVERDGPLPPPPEYAPPPIIHRYAVTDERVRLPVNGGGGAADAIRLSRLLVGTLARSAHFTTAIILSLRRWAKARHLYGSKYGYPGGSAWTVTGLRTGSG